MTKRKYLIVAAVAILAGAYFNQYPTAADSIAAVASAAVAAVAAYKVNRIIIEEEKNK